MRTLASAKNNPAVAAVAGPVLQPGQQLLYTADGRAVVVQASQTSPAPAIAQQLVPMVAQPVGNPGTGFATVAGSAPVIGQPAQFGVAVGGGGLIVPQQNTYDNYLSSPQNDIWEALMTEAGRNALGAQMAIPIRSELDYQGVARRFFEIDVLAQGQIARYDKDIDVKAYVVSKRGAVDQWTVEGEYVEPKTWEIFAVGEIRLSEIQQRRFNVLDRTQEKLRIQTQITEDTQFLQLLDTIADGNSGVNPLATGSSNSKTFLNDLTATIMDHDLPCYAILMRFDSFKDIREWGTEEVDPVTMREILNTGLYGNIWGIDLIVSRLVTKGTVYAITEPRFFGVMPIRTEYIVMPDDVPRQATIGFVGYEELGMLSVNANGLAKGTHNI